MNNYPQRNNYRGPRRPEDPVRAGIICNEQIRYPEVRVVGSNGESLGIMPSWQALRTARDQELDLVEITASAKPPVVRIVELGKWIYGLKRAKKDQEKKIRENVIVTKEIQLRPVTDKHDLAVKINHAKEFLANDIKVRVVVKFKGRELSFSDKGFAIIRAFLDGVGDCRIEKEPEMNGKSILVIIAPAAKNN